MPMKHPLSNKKLRTKKTSLGIIPLASLCILLSTLSWSFLIIKQSNVLPSDVASFNADVKSDPALGLLPTDPSSVNCNLLLQDFRDGKIEEMERRPGFEKAFLTRTTTEKPFFWSCHKPELDSARGSSCEKGMYYEKQLSKRIVEVFEKDAQNGKESIMLDVGGNIGWFSLLAAAHGASEVYTFEPNPANMVRFCESLTLNGWVDDGQKKKTTVIPIMKGVGAKEEVLPLYRAHEINPGSFTFSQSRARKLNAKTIVGELPIVTLDSFAEEHGWFKTRPSIAFFKLDVEGFEANIMEGAKQLFKSGIIEWFSFEMKPGHVNLTDDAKKMIIELLFTSGYELYMSGRHQGPRNLVDKKYEKWEDLAEDIINDIYPENLLFKKVH